MDMYFIIVISRIIVIVIAIIILYLKHILPCNYNISTALYVTANQTRCYIHEISSGICDSQSDTMLHTRDKQRYMWQPIRHNVTSRGGIINLIHIIENTYCSKWIIELSKNGSFNLQSISFDVTLNQFLKGPLEIRYPEIKLIKEHSLRKSKVVWFYQIIFLDNYIIM